MGSSYRQDLNSGHGPRDWHEKLLEAADLIDEVADDVSKCIYDTGQFDNAAHDGGLRERLRITSALIRGELPKPKEDS